MPDWVYRTVAQRGLFRLPDAMARGVALGVIGTLGKSAAGRSVIEFMGHMAPDKRLEVALGGVRLASPIGLGWRVDPEERATAGLACFGVGCIEVMDTPARTVRRGAGETLVDGPTVALAGGRTRAGPVPLLRRRRDGGGRECMRLPDGADLTVVAWDSLPPPDAELAGDFARGVVLQVGTLAAGGGWSVPAGMPGGLPERVREWRRVLPQQAPVIIAGGIGGPEDAVALVEAGATLVLVEAGLVYRGPGLVKRCNEALLARWPVALVGVEKCGAGAEADAEVRGEAEAGRRAEAEAGIFKRAWFWTTALGVAMAAGGVAALALAVTRVLLPYDEHYLGLTAAALERTMPRLFAFMAHDRATLAGVMLGLGWLYACLGRDGIRTGRHGAKTAVIASALAGFASFFAFFGFGYFDTLHAFVAVVLFQFTVQIMTGAPGGGVGLPIRADPEDAAWRRAQWGQLCWVVHATGLLIAGGVILGIGMGAVFVSEDLGFLCMTGEQARELGERMVGVIAHDRATLGGMLLAAGTAMLLPLLWSFRRGEAWLWRALAGLGVPAYGAAIGIHYHVGYTDWRHMVPAWLGLGLWVAGLGLSREYLGAQRGPR